MIRFIDLYRDRFGVEPICRVLSEHMCGGFITSRGYRAGKARGKSARQQRDEWLIPVLQRVHAENYGVYGAVKMQAALAGEGVCIGRDQTARLMRKCGLRGVVRTKGVKTTKRVKGRDTRPDLVGRNFHRQAPRRLWVADITYVRTGSGFAYTAFITDAYSRKIVGWAVRSSMRSEHLAMEALNHALAAASGDTQLLVHHSDRGSQYVARAYTQALTSQGIALSVGRTGDSYDNALAESVNSLYKTELIHQRTWANALEVEYETMNWVHWWNTKRIHNSLNQKTPTQTETNYYQQHNKKLQTL